jgi:hypothetical protein
MRLQSAIPQFALTPFLFASFSIVAGDEKRMDLWSAINLHCNENVTRLLTLRLRCFHVAANKQTITLCFVML